MVLGILMLAAIGCGSSSPSAPSPTPSPSPSPSPSGVTLTGFVRETSPTDTVGIENARVEVFNPATGIVTGNFVQTDSRGFYQFPGLASRVDLRASKEGYEGQSRVAQLATGQTTLDFNLMPLSRRPPRENIVVGQTHTGSISSMDPTCAGMYFILPCKRYAFTVGAAASFRAYLKWANLRDLDLELWRDDRLVTASLTCQACGVGTAEEVFTESLPPGNYELRVTWYWLGDTTAQRAETTSYDLTVTPVG